MSATTLAMRIKEIMANMPDSINTIKGIDEYYKNAMMIDIKKTNSKFTKVIAKKNDKTSKKYDIPNIPNKSPIIVISNINAVIPIIQDTTCNKVSQFTKDIEKTTELVKSKKIIKKGYKVIYSYDDEPSFSTNILVAARKINKSLISDRKEVFNKQHI
jgi:hypothetical protein